MNQDLNTKIQSRIDSLMKIKSVDDYLCLVIFKWMMIAFNKDVVLQIIKSLSNGCHHQGLYELKHLNNYRDKKGWNIDHLNNINSFNYQ